MRQGQQNRRGRGRNNNHSNNNNNNQQHRKGGQNPLSRSYESAGPDTKIRGTPAHIAEKYMQLARDAQSSGDPVLAENYLQHAEHYNRIIMTYREQQVQNGEAQPQNGQIGRFRPAGMSDEEFAEEEGGDDYGGNQQPLMRQGEPQPRVEGSPRFDDRPRQDQRHQQNRDRGEPRSFNERGDRPDRNDRADRGDRAERGERFDRQDRPERREPSDRSDRPERTATPPPEQGDAPPRRRERAPIPTHEQPEFLRRPVRRPRREAAGDEPADAPPTETVGDGD